MHSKPVVDFEKRIVATFSSSKLTGRKGITSRSAIQPLLLLHMNCGVDSRGMKNFRKKSPCQHANDRPLMTNGIYLGKKKDTYVCTSESLCCTPAETNTG